jgi:biotin operon repressor
MNTDLQEEILGNIPRFPNHITGSDLAYITGLHGSNVIRKHINALRSVGHPIVSDPDGYYIATNSEQIEKCIQSLRSRCVAIEDAICGLYKSFGAVAQ